MKKAWWFSIKRNDNCRNFSDAGTFFRESQNHANSESYLYTPCIPPNAMKKQAEQKTKGHKAKDITASVSSTPDAGPLSKEKINSLKDRNAAKTKKK